jgi:GT2 family glycosyltransferase
MFSVSTSFIIPTKNRITDLIKTIKSINKQNILPNELLIIDQSFNNCESRIKSVLKNKVKLKYYHEVEIKSLTQAKNFALKKAGGDIIFFLEDDIILSKDFIINILKTFSYKKTLKGVCGILINERISFFKKFVKIILYQGLFSDPRLKQLNNLEGKEIIMSDKISGGISAWKKKVFLKTTFDSKNKLHLFEDIDFSVRVNKLWKNSTAIVTSSQVEHKRSRINRNNDIKLLKMKIKESYIFYNKNSKTIFKADYLLFKISLFFFSVFLTIKNFDIKYLIMFFTESKFLPKKYYEL